MEEGKERPRRARSVKSVKNEPEQGQTTTAGVRHEPGFAAVPKPAKSTNTPSRCAALCRRRIALMSAFKGRDRVLPSRTPCVRTPGSGRSCARQETGPLDVG